MQTNYKSQGLVLGNLWGGGRATYPAREVEAESFENLIAQNQKMLKSGTLDSGMGFDGLRGAVLYIRKIETKKDGFKRESMLEPVYVGELSDLERVELASVYF